MGSYTDLVTIQRDLSPAGAADPDWRTVLMDLPCWIDYTSGQEAYRGRQLEAGVRFVVRFPRDPSVRVRPDYRLVVKSARALDPGELLHVMAVNSGGDQRGDQIETWLFCGYTAL